MSVKEYQIKTLENASHATTRFTRGTSFLAWKGESKISPVAPRRTYALVEVGRRHILCQHSGQIAGTGVQEHRMRSRLERMHPTLKEHADDIDATNLFAPHQLE